MSSRSPTDQPDVRGSGASSPRLTLAGAVREAVLSLGAAPRRTLTNAAVVMIGVAMSVGAAAVGESGRRAVLDEFEQMRATELTLLEREPRPIADRGFPNDLDQRLRAVGPVSAAGVLITTEPVEVAPRWDPDGGRSITVYGVDSSTLDALGATGVPAVSWRAEECDRVGLIGVEAAHRLSLGVFPESPGAVDIAGQPVAVVGALLSADLLPGLVDGIAVPECAVRLMGLPVVSRKVIVRVHRGAAESVARVAPLAARPWAPESLVASFVPRPTRLQGAVERSTLRTVQFVSLGVMVLSALVLTVTTGSAIASRRAEIGLRRVFGARPRDVYSQIVLESCFVGLAGGVAGTTLGMVGTVATALVAGWVAATPLYAWLAGPAAGAAVGALAALVPARLASRVEARAALGQV